MNPSAVVADPTDDECPGCEATGQVWTCAACGLDFARTAVHPALSIIGLLPPELRTATFLALLRTEVAPTSQGNRAMSTVVCLPMNQIVEFEALASYTTWWCRICGRGDTATTTPQATDNAVAHLGADHGGVRTP